MALRAGRRMEGCPFIENTHSSTELKIAHHCFPAKPNCVSRCHQALFATNAKIIMNFSDYSLEVC